MPSFLERLPLIGRLFQRKASRAERAIINLFPGWTTLGVYNTWSANRAELVQHFRGWTYIAVKAIAEELGAAEPQVAYVRNGEDVAAAKAKAKAITDPAARRVELARLEKRFVRRSKVDAIRKSGLAVLQPNDELEPVGRDHDLLRLLRNPNGPDTAYTFFYRLALQLELTGLAYIWASPDRAGDDVVELWPFPSAWVRARGDETNVFAEYEIRPASGYTTDQWSQGWFPGGSGRLVVPGDEIIQIAYPHPIHPFDGMSPLTAIPEWIDSAEAIDQSRVYHFRNGAFPNVVLQVDPTVADPTEPEIKRMLADFRAKYQGVRRTNEPLVLAPGITVVPTNQTPEEMDYVAGADQLKSFILAAHRVGESIAGLTENTNYASMVAARANFYQSTMRPKFAFLGQVLTEKLAARFEDDLVVYWEEAVPSDPDFELRKEQAHVQMGAKTLNEVRTDAGREPFEHGGDDPILPMGMSPIPLATGEEPLNLPVPALAAQEQQQEQQQGGDGNPLFGGDDQGGELPAALGEENGNGNGKPEMREELLRGMFAMNGKTRN